MPAHLIKLTKHRVSAGVKAGRLQEQEGAATTDNGNSI